MRIVYSNLIKCLIYQGFLFVTSFIFSERLAAKQCLDHPWVTGKVTPSSGITENEAEEHIEEEMQNDKQERVTEKRKMDLESEEALQDTKNLTNADFLSFKSNLENENIDNRLLHDKTASWTDSEKDSYSASADNMYLTHLEIIPTKIQKCNSLTTETQALMEIQHTTGDVAYQKEQGVSNVLCPQKECQAMDLDNTDDVNSNYGNKETEITHI